MNRLRSRFIPHLTSSGWSQDLIDFLRKCLVKDMNKRASVDELLEVGAVSASQE